MSGSTPDKTDKSISDARAERIARLRSRTLNPASDRQSLAGAVERMGGAEGLADWAMEDARNEEKFWTTLYPKLIPLEITADVGGAIKIAAAIEAARKRVREAEALATDPTPGAGDAA